MSIKKKIGLGVASAALGISLVGGGTWAAFNDTATINNNFAAGTLDLEVGKLKTNINFDLSNLKPGDRIERLFELNNKGSIAIKEVLLHTTSGGFADPGEDSSESEFLDQFQIQILSDSESENYEPRKKVFADDAVVTLADLRDGTYTDALNEGFLATDGSNRINLAPLVVEDEEYRGIPVDPEVDFDRVRVIITFINNETDRVGGQYSEFYQNKFQGDAVDFFFNLEATQWAGMNVRDHDANGKVNNGVQGSADDTTDPIKHPADRTVDADKAHDDEVSDN